MGGTVSSPEERSHVGTHRKMASVQTVAEIRPIEGADRIEVAVVGGWQCVVGKGEFHAGDKVAYLEIDTFLPGGDPRFAAFMERGKKSMELDGQVVEGHVLRTAKLRGTYSQGLVMSLGDLGVDATSHKVGDDISEEIGVCKYEPIEVTPDTIGGYDSSLAPVTDAMRLQSCVEVWPLVQRAECRTSVKVDGTSMTLVCDTRDGNPRLRVFGHRYELSPTEGLGAQAIRACEAQGIVGFCESHPDVVVQFEFAGPKVNGNRLGLPAHRAFVFALWRDGREKVPFEDESECGADYDAIRAAACPVLDVSPASLGTPDDAIRWAEGLCGNICDGRLDEGVVLHVMGRGGIPEGEWEQARMALMDALGEPLELKIINNRYLLRHKA